MWPSLKQLMRDVPTYFQEEYADPIDAFHPYLIERVIQADLAGETLAVGPEGIMPEWMGCRAVLDLEEKYPAVWRSIHDRVMAAHNQPTGVQPSENQEPLSPLSLRARVQKPTK